MSNKVHAQSTGRRRPRRRFLNGAGWSLVALLGSACASDSIPPPGPSGGDAGVTPQPPGPKPLPPPGPTPVPTPGPNGGSSDAGGEPEEEACTPGPLPGGRTVVLACTVSPHGLTLRSGFLYWIENSHGGTARVFRLPAAGGSAQLLAESEGAATALAVSGEEVFWASEDAGAIWRASVTGGPALLVADAPHGVVGLAVDDTHVFWSENRLNGEVKSTPRSGGEVATLALDETVPAGSELLFGAEGLVWTRGNAVMTKALGSSNPPTALVRNVVQPRFLETDGTSLYFASPFAVRAVPLSGGPVTLLAEETPIHALAIDDTAVYWASGLDSAALKRVPKDGGTPTTLETGDATPYGLVVDTSTLYWSTRRRILSTTETESRHER